MSQSTMPAYITSRRFTEVSIDDVRRLRRRGGTTISQELQDWGPSPERRYLQEELRRILETTISKLARGYRIVFHLRDIEGCSTEETAQALRLSLATLKTRTRRARLQLRDSLDAYFRPPTSQNSVGESNQDKKSVFNHVE